MIYPLLILSIAKKRPGIGPSIDSFTSMSSVRARLLLNPLVDVRLRAVSLLPVRASEQGNVIGLVSVYIREYGSTLYVGLARDVSPTNTNFRLTFLLTRLQEALYEDLAE